MADKKSNIVIQLVDNATAGMKKIGSGFQSLGSFATSLTGIFSILAGGAAMGAVIKASEEKARVLAQLDAALQSTEGAVGKTREQITSYANELQNLTGVDDDVIGSGQAMLLTFKNIQTDAFDRTTKAVLDYSTAMTGGNVTQESMRGAAIQVGKALNDPLVGLTALNRAGVQFSDQQKQNIQYFVETNQLARAQNIILGELESQFGGSAESAGNAGIGMLKFKASLEDIMTTVGQGLTPVLRFAFNSFDTLTGSLVKTNKEGVSPLTTAVSVLGMGLLKIVQIISNIVAIDKLMVESMYLGVQRLIERFKSYGEILAAIPKGFDAIQAAYRKSQETILKGQVEENKLFLEHSKTKLKIAQDYEKAWDTLVAFRNGKQIESTQKLNSIMAGLYKEDEDHKIASDEEKRQREKEARKLQQADDEERLDEIKNKYDNELIFYGDLQTKKLEIDAQANAERAAAIEEMLARDNLSVEDRIRLEKKLRETQQAATKTELLQRKNASDQIVSFAKGISDAVVSEEENKGAAILKVGQRYLDAQIDAWVAAQIAKATAEAGGMAIGSLGASFLALGPTIAGIYAAGTAAKAVIHSIKFHDGGIVPQTSAPNREVPAILQSGEEVLTQRDSEDIRRFMRDYRAGRLSGGSQPQTVTVNLMLDRRVLAQEIVTINQMQGTGVL